MNTLQSLVTDIHTATPHISFNDLWVFLRERNVADLFDVWESFKFVENYKPTIFCDLDGEINLEHSILTVPHNVETERLDMMSFFSFDDTFPVGVFHNVEDASVWGELPCYDIIEATGIIGGGGWQLNVNITESNSH